MRKTISPLFVAVFLFTGGLTGGSVSAQFSSIPCDPSGDFVTGGGFIIVNNVNDAHANFGVAGGCKNGFLWGHLEYVDHGSGLAPVTPFKVHGTGVTEYFADPSDPMTTRWVGGTAETNDPGNPTVNYCVRVADNGEGGSGTGDTLAIILSNGYSVAGPLVGGNIQIHKPNPLTPTGDCLNLVAPQ
jgi:hypothetical protein